ncbi:MAG: hypothetical protein GY782_08605 [Gammaproteobacteria bacterium]|nr:hypothetical protein [Gammaproteobacteria bacterium]
MARIKDIVYIEKIEGRDKPIYRNCGSLFQTDEGRLSIKLDMIPVGNFNGWLQCFDLRPKDNEEAF